jgi:hypothetical protein
MRSKPNDDAPAPLIPGAFERGAAPPEQPAQVSPPVGTNPVATHDETVDAATARERRNEGGGSPARTSSQDR